MSSQKHPDRRRHTTLLRELRVVTADHPLIGEAIASEQVSTLIGDLDWLRTEPHAYRRSERIANQIEDYLAWAGQPLHEAITMDHWKADCVRAIAIAAR